MIYAFSGKIMLSLTYPHIFKAFLIHLSTWLLQKFIQFISVKPFLFCSIVNSAEKTIPFSFKGASGTASLLFGLAAVGSHFSTPPFLFSEKEGQSSCFPFKLSYEK